MMLTGDQLNSEIRYRFRDQIRPAGCWLFVLAMLCGPGVGCSLMHQEEESVKYVPRFGEGVRVAVAPALNFSGSADFDPVKVADLMASELSGFEGVGVIGVNRVLAVLAEQGIEQVQSPEHALDICHRLGADVLCVFAVTEYNAYTPVVGLAAQLYGKRPATPPLDPVAASRMARPVAVTDRIDETSPWAQVQRVFNADHEDVQADVRRYADARGAKDSPYDWRRFVASQQLYLRYCCYTVARELMVEQIDNQAVAEVVSVGEHQS